MSFKTSKRNISCSCTELKANLLFMFSTFKVRHLYFPCIRCGLNKNIAMVLVFFFSAVMHEYVISIPFHMLHPWSFLGMMGQIPLVAITKYADKLKPGSSLGNMIFWLTFCIVGQPMAILMYTIDHYYKKEVDESDCTGFSCGEL